MPVSENSMKRMPIPNLVLAAVLALLLPLEQAHCVWMGFEKHAAPVATSAPTGHECCESPSSPAPDHHKQPAGKSHGCVCEQIPTAALPTLFTAGTEAPSVTSIAMLTVPSVIAQVSIVTETVPALDVGSSPLLNDPGAHGLRAPPVSA